MAQVATSSKDAVTYGLDVVCQLEQEMTTTLPKSWSEDMMFLKANNISVHIGAPVRKKTKEIHLHYGTKKGEDGGDDEWRSNGAKAVSKDTIGGLIRKLGEANFDVIVPQLVDVIKGNDELQEMVDEIMKSVSFQCGSHQVMIHLIRHMRSANPSFEHPVCSLPDDSPLLTPTFGIWANTCFKNNIISEESYHTIWNTLMKKYQALQKDDKADWGPVFEQPLKEKIAVDWWSPQLKALLDNPETPLTICFKIEDYFEN